MKASLVLSFLILLSAFSCWCGCTTSRVIENTRVPEIFIDESGTIIFNNERVELKKIAAAVKAAGFEKTQEVNILIPDNPDRALMRDISRELIVHGYTRTIFVKNRKATAVVPSPGKK